MQFVSFSQFSIIVLVLGIIGSHLKVPFVQSLIVLRNLLREDLDACTHDHSFQLVLIEADEDVGHWCWTQDSPVEFGHRIA